MYQIFDIVGNSSFSKFPPVIMYSTGCFGDALEIEICLSTLFLILVTMFPILDVPVFPIADVPVLSIFDVSVFPIMDVPVFQILKSP